MAYEILISGTEVRVAYIAIGGYIIFCLSALIIVWLCFKECTEIDKLAEAPDVNESNYDPTAILADVNINMKNHQKNKKQKLETEIDLAEAFDLRRRATTVQMVNLEPQKSMKQKSSDSLYHHESEETDVGSLNNINLSDNAYANNPEISPNILSMSNSTHLLLHSKSLTHTTNTLQNEPDLPEEDFPNLPDDEPSIELKVNSEYTQIHSPKKHNIDDSIQVFIVDEDEENDRFGGCKCIKSLFSLINKLQILIPILFHFWDMATDLAVICDWIPDANYENPQDALSPNGQNLNTFYFIIASIMSQLLYRSVSGYRYAKKFNACGGFLQFLDLMLFFEVYASVHSTSGKSTLQLRWIRKMESVFESAPQAFIQLHYVLRYRSLDGNDEVPILNQVSFILSVMSITMSVVRSDEWKIRDSTHANKLYHWKFFVRAIFRLCEILSRLFVMALIFQIAIYGKYLVSAILLIEFIFYFVMYKDGFLGNDLGNIAEILIVHPNLSLRVSDEEIENKTESTLGWIFRTFLCWTPISGLMVCCKKKRVEKRNRSMFNMCIHYNLVTVHFLHRCFESLVELFLFFLMTYVINDNVNEFESLIFENGSFTRTMFVIALIGSLMTPLLYNIVRRWFIVGQDGLEMNVFGFLHHAHSEDDTTQFIRYVYRVRNCVNQKNKFERTPLMEAVLLPNYELCKFICSLIDIIDLSLTDNKNKQIIHYVAEFGDDRFMKLVLDTKRDQDKKIFGVKHFDNKHHIKQMDINAVYGPQKKTALIVCCEMGYSNCTHLLLSAGANANYQDKLGRTSLHYAIFGESSAQLPTDENNENENDKLTEEEKEKKTLELRDGYYLIIQQFLSYSPDLTLCDKKRGWNALFQAVGGGSLKIVDLLINDANCPRLDALDRKNECLLHTAVRYNRFNVLKYLLTQTNHAWNLEHKNVSHQSPLQLAITTSNLVCMQYLITFGPETINALKKALLLAVKINCVDVVKMLLKEYHIDPNYQDNEGMTPLRWAAVEGFKQVTKALLIGGARDDIDRFGENIVFYAARNNRLMVLQLLQKANADFCVVNRQGQTATDKTSNAEIIQFITSVRDVQRQYH